MSVQSNAVAIIKRVEENVWTYLIKSTLLCYYALTDMIPVCATLSHAWRMNGVSGYGAHAVKTVEVVLKVALSRVQTRRMTALKKLSSMIVSASKRNESKFSLVMSNLVLFLQDGFPETGKYAIVLAPVVFLQELSNACVVPMTLHLLRCLRTFALQEKNLALKDRATNKLVMLLFGGQAIGNLAALAVVARVNMSA